MACTEAELVILEEAAALDGRDSVSEYIRSVVMQAAKARITNERSFVVSTNLQGMAEETKVANAKMAKMMELFPDSMIDEMKKQLPNLPISHPLPPRK